MPEMFHGEGVFVLGEAERLAEVQDTEEWLATDYLVEVRR